MPHLKGYDEIKINYINYVSKCGIILLYLKESGKEQTFFCTSSQKPKLNENTTKKITSLENTTSKKMLHRILDPKVLKPSRVAVQNQKYSGIKLLFLYIPNIFPQK